jgi:hypothetical protein
MDTYASVNSSKSSVFSSSNTGGEKKATSVLLLAIYRYKVSKSDIFYNLKYKK